MGTHRFLGTHACVACKAYPAPIHAIRSPTVMASHLLPFSRTIPALLYPNGCFRTDGSGCSRRAFTPLDSVPGLISEADVYQHLPWSRLGHRLFLYGNDAPAVYGCNVPTWKRKRLHILPPILNSNGRWPHLPESHPLELGAFLYPTPAIVGSASLLTFFSQEPTFLMASMITFQSPFVKCFLALRIF